LIPVEIMEAEEFLCKLHLGFLKKHRNRVQLTVGPSGVWLDRSV
jgi:hypothetical protein